jgi:hypothetical protein
MLLARSPKVIILYPLLAYHAENNSNRQNIVILLPPPPINVENRTT